MNHLGELMPDISNYPLELEELLNKNLLFPVKEFFSKSGKNIRPRLVQLGYQLAHNSDPEITSEINTKILQASAIIEMIHSGSLIVDDIQDGSTVRRNEPSLHLKHGIPLALNAGNWLYFQALNSVKKLRLPPSAFIDVMDDLLGLMSEAHMGQALDLGTKIDSIPQHLVKSTCHTSMMLKTGTITSLALRLGMAISGKSENKQKVLQLGRELGLMLQMYDDFGNFTESKNDQASKRHEDLYNRRPTWIWAQASVLSADIYQEFQSAVSKLPNESELMSWTEKNSFLEQLESESKNFTEKIYHEVEARWKVSHPVSLNLLFELKTILETSYVKKN